MSYYSGYPGFDMDYSVAQSCKEFGGSKGVRGREVGVEEGITCMSCRNWNGSECIKNHYGRVASRLGIY